MNILKFFKQNNKKQDDFERLTQEQEKSKKGPADCWPSGTCDPEFDCGPLVECSPDFCGPNDSDSAHNQSQTQTPRSGPKS